MCNDHFCAENPANKAKCGDSSSTQLVLVDPTSDEYESIKNDLIKSWLHPDRARPTNIVVYKVVMKEKDLNPYLRYRARLAGKNKITSDERLVSRANERFVYHGTHKYCDLVETESDVTPCTSTECALCSILRISFEVTKCGSKRPSMFGKGVYLADVASKADRYVENRKYPGGRMAMLLNRAAFGKMYDTKTNNTTLSAAPDGYDSVHGVPGPELIYDEMVLYKNEAVRPAYLVVYTRDGSTPRPAGRRPRRGGRAPLNPVPNAAPPLKRRTFYRTIRKIVTLGFSS